MRVPHVCSETWVRMVAWRKVSFVVNGSLLVHRCDLQVQGRAPIVASDRKCGFMQTHVSVRHGAPALVRDGENLRSAISFDPMLTWQRFQATGCLRLALGVIGHFRRELAKQEFAHDVIEGVAAGVD